MRLPGCISFDPYIKPQPLEEAKEIGRVVYLLIPTSNHNSLFEHIVGEGVVYLLIPTSNHNRRPWFVLSALVVYLLIPTSNHNLLE